jgi:hypothetical protein
MNRPTVSWTVFNLLVTTSLLSLMCELRGQEFSDFATDPHWQGFRNRLLPKVLPIAQQDFGYRGSNVAGGESAGEIGGTIQRSHRRAYYAKLIVPKTLEEKLSASGKFSVRGAGGGSGVLVGWFNHELSQGWRTPSSLAFRIDGNGGKYWVFYEYGTTNRATGGGGAYEGLRYQTTSTLPFPDDGAVHRWSLEYDPQDASGLGVIKFRIDDRTYRLPLHPGHRAQGATFDRFGIWTQQTPGEVLELYLDDVQIDGVEESFDHDPQWAQEGNHDSYQQRVLRPYHAFGYSNTNHTGGQLGEIGGIVFRDERPAYYADVVGPYSMEDELEAAGRITLRSASADSGVMLGWFNEAAKRSKESPEHEKPQTDYLGIYLEGPSRVGHYIRPAYSNSRGNHDAPTFEGMSTEGPVVLPDGQVHDWALRYDPKAARERGKITLMFDGIAHQLELKEGVRAEGATFDRFGLFNIQSGGHHVEVFLDDISYSK